MNDVVQALTAWGGQKTRVNVHRSPTGRTHGRINGVFMAWIHLFWKCSAQSTHTDAYVVRIMYATWFDL